MGYTFQDPIYNVYTLYLHEYFCLCLYYTLYLFSIYYVYCNNIIRIYYAYTKIYMFYS